MFLITIVESTAVYTHPKFSTSIISYSDIYLKPELRTHTGIVHIIYISRTNDRVQKCPDTKMTKHTFFYINIHKSYYLTFNSSYYYFRAKL